MHSREEHKEEYVVNVGTVATQMARYGRVFGLDRETHSVAIYLEHTGAIGENDCWSCCCRCRIEVFPIATVFTTNT